MFSCPNCGGKMYFDIQSQKLKCAHCGSLTAVEDYQLNNNAEQRAEDDMTVYTCRNCGAQLVSPDQSAVAFCSYCGSEQILEEKLNEYKRPDKIIPFRVTKNQCRAQYKNILKKSFYAPKEFRDPQFMERFRGIYIPYWHYEGGFAKSPVETEGYATYSRGDYTYNEKYDLKAELKGPWHSMCYDGSSSFDDTIAETIAPFRAASFKDFETGYLAGFYADTADVPPEKYETDVLRHAASLGEESLKRAYSSKNITPSLPSSEKKLQALLKPEIRRTGPYLVPVWFLTWRKNDRVAYAVVNGETGKITSDLPVDAFRFFAVTVLCAAVLFCPLTLFVSMTAPTALFLSAFIAWIVSWIYRREIMHLHDHENHIFDRGYFIDERPGEISGKKAEKIRKRRHNLSAIGAVVAGFFILLVLLMVFMDYGDYPPAEKAQLGCTFLLLPAFWNLFRSLTFVRHMKDKTYVLEALSCFAGIAAAVWVLYSDPVYDWWYYLGCLVCLGGVMITCFGLIRRYNLLSTRAVPVLFERQGGIDHAEE